MRSIVYRFQDLDRLDALLDRAAEDSVLDVPSGDEVDDGEWVLAIFEVGTGKRATAAAARGTDIGGGPPKLALESRDFQRIRDFVASARAAAHPSSEGSVPRSPVPPPRPTPTQPVSLDDAGTFALKLGAGARVLLVDDDPDIRNVVGAMLGAVGLVVSSAPSAEEALRETLASDFDLLLIDWNLPGISGLDLCRAIRAEKRTATIPVLFLTGNTSSEDMVEAFASGADDYVVKPFRAPELGARIFGLLRRARVAGHGPSRPSS